MEFGGGVGGGGVSGEPVEVEGEPNVWRWLRTAAGLAPPPPLFTCPVIHPDTDGECGGPVYPSPYTFAVRCAACGETWDGQMALRRLGLVAS